MPRSRAATVVVDPSAHSRPVALIGATVQEFLRDMPDVVFDQWPVVVFVPVVLVVLAVLVAMTRWHDSRDPRHRANT